MIANLKHYIRNRHGRIVECTSAEHAAMMIKDNGAVAAMELEVKAHLESKSKKRAKSAVREVAEKRVALDAAAARAAAAAPDVESDGADDEEDAEEEEAPQIPEVVPRAAAEAALRSKNKSELVSIAAAHKVEGVTSALKVDEIRYKLTLEVMSGAIALSEVM